MWDRSTFQVDAMRKLKLILGGVWSLAAIALLIFTIIDFGAFYLLMTVGCTGMATLLFLEYFWTRDTEYEGDSYDRGVW